MAILVAMQIVLTRLLSISIGNWMRIGFGFLPTAVAGMLMGPVASALVALVSDVLGTILQGNGAIIILYTASTVFVGFCYGLALHRPFVKQTISYVDCMTAMLALALISIPNSFILASAGITADAVGSSWPDFARPVVDFFVNAHIVMPQWITTMERQIKSIVQYPVNVLLLLITTKTICKMPKQITRI